MNIFCDFFTITKFDEVNFFYFEWLKLDTHMIERGKSSNNVQTVAVHFDRRCKHVPNILSESIVWTPRIN